MSHELPADVPPSYAQATGSSTTSNTARPANGIPVQSRRSMEDENRPLPAGWIRQYDAKNNHQFFVDTRTSPPRSIWHHPYDDDKYLATLSSEERERIEELNRHPSRADILSMSSSEDLNSPSAGRDGKTGTQAPHHHQYTETSGYHAGPSNGPPPKGIKKFGRGLKDKLTGTTHEEREQERRQREIEEQREYEMHLRIRQAMQAAINTGQPQKIGRDNQGRDVFIEPPNWGGPAYGGGGYGYNPYHQGPYQTPNAVYVRPPEYEYSRPIGYGYGGGYGYPLAAGFLGGALLGGLLF